MALKGSLNCCSHPPQDVKNKRLANAIDGIEPNTMGLNHA